MDQEGRVPTGIRRRRWDTGASWGLKRKLLTGLAGAVLVGALAAGPVAAQIRPAKVAQGQPYTFNMVVSAGAANCLPGATASVTITPLDSVEEMDVSVSGLPADTEFDFFVIQVPNAPFGVAWYQGDIDTDDYGNGFQSFLGRFQIETFAVAPGTAPAPVVFTDTPFPDANQNPPFGPIHTYHLGLWFGSPDDAQAAGCPNTETPFNGTHTAGIQVLNTSNFADDQGPLRQVSAAPAAKGHHPPAKLPRPAAGATRK